MYTSLTPRAYVRKTLAERFWPKVQRTKDDECWLWTGASTGGYGYLGRIPATSNGPEQPAVYAHRLSYEIHHGPITDPEMCVCHHCDVPLCVNPGHLFLGTKKDNNQDRDKKGRGRLVRACGEAHPNAKLTEAKVREIVARVEGGESQGAVAVAFDIRQSDVSRLVNRTSWRHLWTE